MAQSNTPHPEDPDDKGYVGEPPRNDVGNPNAGDPHPDDPYGVGYLGPHDLIAGSLAARVAAGEDVSPTTDGPTQEGEPVTEVEPVAETPDATPTEETPPA